MSRLRPECNTSHQPATFSSRLETLRAVYKSVARRRSLAFGVLDDHKKDKHCAMGCLWEDFPEARVRTHLIDEIAAVNDSVPADAPPKQRWDTVMNWLRIQLGEQI